MTLSPRLRIILGILGILLIAGLLGWGLWALMIRTTPQVEDDETQEVDEDDEDGRLTLSEEISEREAAEDEDGDGQLPSSVADGGETFTQRLTSSAITSPVAIGGETVAYYDPTDGRFYAIDSSGELVALSDAQFPEAESVVIADSGDMAAIEFPDGSNILYDLAREEQITLPSHWEDFEFSEDGNEVVNKTISIDSNSNALVVSSSDGSRTEVIAALGDNADEVTVNWSPSDTVVAFSSTGTTQSGFGREQIYLISDDGDAIGALVVEGGNFSAQWSPSGAGILYSVSLASAGDRPSLWYTNATGNIGSERENLGVYTWVEKCTFSEEMIAICAVPTEVPNGSGLDPRLVDAYDEVYEINLETGRVTLLGTPVLDMQMFNLSVSDDGSILYFTDGAGRLNFMRLS